MPRGIALVSLAFAFFAMTAVAESPSDDGSCDVGSSDCAANDPDQIKLLQLHLQAVKVEESRQNGGPSAPPSNASGDAPAQQNASEEEDDKAVAIKVQTLENVLQKAAPLADSRQAQDITRARDLLEHDKAQQAEASADVAKERDVIMDAVELVESSDLGVEVADAEGTLVTQELLEMVTGDDGSEQRDADNPNAVEGDMVASGPEEKAALIEASKAGRRWHGTQWPRGKDIPFCFSPGTSGDVKRAVRDATVHITANVWCVRFKEVAWKSQRCVEHPGMVVLTNKDGCWSHIGMRHRYSVNEISLSSDYCASMGVAAHEILHALGMLHEQSRGDRGKHVRILWQNIRDPSKNHNFRESNDEDVTGTTDYDFLSLMHYSKTAFGKENDRRRSSVGEWASRRRYRETTIETIPPGHTIGQRSGMSELDVVQLAKMYCTFGGPRLVKHGSECNSGDNYMGTKESVQECAKAVKAVGGSFFIFGRGRKEGWCYKENTRSETCPEGWETDYYDFYSLA